MLAVREELTSTEVIQQLLLSGADPNALNKVGLYRVETKCMKD